MRFRRQPTLAATVAAVAVSTVTSETVVGARDVNSRACVGFPRPRGAVTPRVLMLLAAVILAMALAPTRAQADGDPASDVLIVENVFYPYSPTVSLGLQGKLNAETAAASRRHFPIKVALIESPLDLGAITSLFGQPQNYADFLAQEISYLGNKQMVLVVMPNGYGVSGLNHRAALAVRGIKKPVSRRSDDLARAAIVAVAKLASAAGHPIKNIGDAPAAAEPSSGGTLIEVLLALAAIAGAGAILALRHRRARPPPHRRPRRRSTGR
jgi:hypothetical protein